MDSGLGLLHPDTVTMLAVRHFSDPRLRPGPLQAESGPLAGIVGGPGGYPACFLQNSSPCLWRIPAGARRTPAGQFTGLIRGLFIAGARVTFKLELKVTRTPRRVKKMDGTRSGSLRVPCGTAKKGQKQLGNCPERPLL